MSLIDKVQKPDCLFGRVLSWFGIWKYYNNSVVYTVRSMRTEENDLIRVLKAGTSVQSATFVDDRRFNLVFGYHEAFALALDKFESPRCFMIGGGGYSFPKYVLCFYSQATITVAEIDAHLFDIACTHFYMQQAIDCYDNELAPRFKNYVMDGLEAVKIDQKAYDIIYNDAFCECDAPAHLLDDTALCTVVESLSERGLYVINVVSALQGANSTRYVNMVNSLKRHFCYVWACFLGDNPSVEDNVVLYASNYEYHFTTDVLPV